MNTCHKYRDVRVSRPERHQWEWKDVCLDQLLPEDHLARVVWAYVDSLDLSPLYDSIKVLKHEAGRSAIAPEILVALWLLATLESISSAREIDRRCTRDLPFMWLCGGVSLNYHSISDFRKDHTDFLESLLVDSVTTLINQDLVSLETIAQDGMRVRANAGSSSFRRKPTLEQLQQEATAHLDRLKQDSTESSGQEDASKRQLAARERAARERKARIEEALRQREELAAKREKRKKGIGVETRCSTTDPDARRMKMANGGYDPAFNVQFATTGDSRIVVGVDVTNEGTDGSQMVPMLEQLEANYGERPRQILVDSAYATQAAVKTTEANQIKVVAGIPRTSQLERNGKDPYSRQRHDSEEYQRFRSRMSQPEYKELYKQRPSIAEFPNAVCRNHGLRQFMVRGLKNVRAVALWHAIAFNFRRILNLGVLG